MLETKGTVTEGGIYGFKLVTGEEIVAKVISKERGEYKFDKPHTVMMSQQGAGLSAWPMIADEDQPVTVPIGHIVAVFTLRADFKAGYEESTNPPSQIVMPKAQGIIT